MDHPIDKAASASRLTRFSGAAPRHARMAGWVVLAVVLAIGGYRLLDGLPFGSGAGGGGSPHAKDDAALDGNLRRGDSRGPRRLAPAKAQPLDRWNALEGLFAEWERSGYFMDRDLEKLFREWFAANPTEALEAVAKLKDLGPRAAGYPSGAILRWGMDTFASDPEPLWRKAEEILGQDTPSMFLFQKDLMHVLGGKNPAAGMDFLKRVSNSRWEELLSTLCAAWGRNEPRAALLALVSSGSPSENALTKRAWRFNVGSMGFEDLAWARKEGIPEEFLAKIRSVSYNREVREGRLEQLLDRAAAQSGSEDLDSRNTHPLALAVATQRPGDFVPNMKRLEEVGAFVPERDAAGIGNLLMEWRSDAARGLFDALADCPAAQASLADSISRYHMRDDANRSAAWIASLPPGPVRDAALAPLLDYLRSHNETESLARWSALLSRAPDAAGSDSP